MSLSPSKNRKFLSAPKPAEVVQVNSSRRETHIEKRIGTVYDAVAGRISNAGFIPGLPFVSRTRDTASSSNVAAAPEVVLFRRKKAPERYEESDYYFANESLPPGYLPESDLLKALHCYASDFYSRAVPKECTSDWRSMDETALLALGILMEELSKESLGSTGDLVFAEGESDAQDADRETEASDLVNSGKVESVIMRTQRRPRGKRRRLDTAEILDEQG